MIPKGDSQSPADTSLGEPEGLKFNRSISAIMAAKCSKLISLKDPSPTSHALKLNISKIRFPIPKKGLQHRKSGLQRKTA